MRRSPLLRVVAAALAASASAALSSVLAPPASATTYPTVAITSPTTGSVLKGTVTVDLLAETDPSGTDTPSTISLLLTSDGVTTAVGSYDCLSLTSSCAGSVSWDATGLSGEETLVAQLTTAAGSVTESTPVTVTIVSPSPTIAITSPADDAVLSGSITVELAGATDPSQSDYPIELDLYDTVVGTTSEIGSYQCLDLTTTSPTCAGPVTWSTVGLSGQQVLTAEVVTDRGLSVTSGPVTVTIDNPAPTVSILSPAAGSVVQGVVTVDLTGATGAGQSDYPGDLALYSTTGGKMTQIGDYPCLAAVASSTTCSGSLTWDTAGLAGPQTLTAQITTSDGLTALSSPVTVTVFADTHLVVHRPAAVVAGTRTTVSGTLEVLGSQTGVPGAIVKLVVEPSVGGSRTLTTRTSSSGAFSFVLRPEADATYLLETGATSTRGASAASAKASVLAPISCRLASARVSLGASEVATCSAPLVPAGTAVTVQFEVRGGSWANLAAAAIDAEGAASLTLPLTAGALHLAAASTATIDLRVVVAANHRFATTVHALGSVVASGSS